MLTPRLCLYPLHLLWLFRYNMKRRHWKRTKLGL